MALSLKDADLTPANKHVLRPWHDVAPFDREAMINARLLALAQVTPRSSQVRLRIEPTADSIRELAQSIRTHGVLLPITVYRDGAQYRIITGERRFHAARAAGLVTIPALVSEHEPDPMALCEQQLIENIQREPMSPFEEGRAYRQLSENCRLTLEQIGERVGKSKGHISKAVRISHLSEQLEEKVSTSKLSDLSFEHLFHVARQPNEAAQLALLDKIAETRPGVRELRDLVKPQGGREGAEPQAGQGTRRSAMQSTRQYRDPAGQFFVSVHFSAKKTSYDDLEEALMKMLDDVRRAKARDNTAQHKTY